MTDAHTGEMTFQAIYNRLRTPVTFLIFGAVMSILWMGVLAYIHTPGVDASGTSTDRIMLAYMSISAVIAGEVYPNLPEQTVDIYHRFGKASVIFAAVNVSLSLTIIIHDYTQATAIIGAFTDQSFAVAFLQTWVTASALLPGPYLGALLASRWSR